MKLKLTFKKIKGIKVTDTEEKEVTRVLVEGCPKPPAIVKKKKEDKKVDEKAKDDKKD